MEHRDTVTVTTGGEMRSDSSLGEPSLERLQSLLPHAVQFALSSPAVVLDALPNLAVLDQGGGASRRRARPRFAPGVRPCRADPVRRAGQFSGTLATSIPAASADNALPVILPRSFQALGRRR